MNIKIVENNLYLSNINNANNIFNIFESDFIFKYKKHIRYIRINFHQYENINNLVYIIKNCNMLYNKKIIIFIYHEYNYFHFYPDINKYLTDNHMRIAKFYKNYNAPKLNHKYNSIENKKLRNRLKKYGISSAMYSIYGQYDWIDTITIPKFIYNKKYDYKYNKVDCKYKVFQQNYHWYKCALTGKYCKYVHPDINLCNEGRKINGE